ncbi:MAG TPA: amidohydrolase family protein [Acidimicrobiia bacterium]|nr:amidohydrolase family protein [Acidimicrobiia bacterium]
MSDTAELLAGLALVDGHCHSILAAPPDSAGFALAATEADRAPSGAARPELSLLDGPAGLAIRRWCAPVLGLPAGAPIDEYLHRRSELGGAEADRRLFRAAGLAELLVDTGLDGAGLAPPAALGAAAGAGVREVVRLERVAERLAEAGVSASGFAAAYRRALAEATVDAVAVKSILAYRGGFGDEADRPSLTQVRTAAGRWLGRLAGSGPAGRARLDDAVLLRFVLWCGVDRGLPVQIHTGFGDRDLRLAAADPARLQPFLAAAEPSGVPFVLLHCYPYHRQAGWLAQVFPHVYVDVGLTVGQVGARADAVLGEFCELAPFAKLVFSTDGFALAERFLVGAAQFRHSFGRLLAAWVADGALPAADAGRVAALVGAGNASRLYGLGR